MSGAPFAVEVGIIDEDGDSLSLEGIDITARINRAEIAGGEPVSTTDATGVAEFEFTVEIAGPDYQIEFMADDDPFEEASTTTQLFDVVAANVHGENSTI